MGLGPAPGATVQNIHGLPQVAAGVYTQATDVEGEVNGNGVLDLDDESDIISVSRQQTPRGGE